MISEHNEKLLERYIAICKNKGLTPNSIKALYVDLHLFLHYIGDKKVEEVNHIDCDDFFTMCMDQRANGDWALARKHTSINMFFQTLIKKEYINVLNPMDKVDKVKVRKRTKEYLTENEVKQVFLYLTKQRDKRGLALFSLMYSSACRISEIYQLNKNSLDFENRSFVVVGKGLKQRECFFSQKAKEYILMYLYQRKDHLEPLFISRENNRWSKRAMQRFVKDTVYEAGINKCITPHSLRHSILTNMRLNGALLEDLQLLAGHSSIATTQSVYTHVGLNDVKDKFDKFHSETMPG